MTRFQIMERLLILFETCYVIDGESRPDTVVKPDKQETHPDAALDPKGKSQVLLVH